MWQSGRCGRVPVSISAYFLKVKTKKKQPRHKTLKKGVYIYDTLNKFRAPVVQN